MLVKHCRYGIEEQYVADGRIRDMDRERMSGVPLIMHHSIIAFWSGLVFVPVVRVAVVR